jgi:hypothetical protein
MLTLFQGTDRPTIPDLDIHGIQFQGNLVALRNAVFRNSMGVAIINNDHVFRRNAHRLGCLGSTTQHAVKLHHERARKIWKRSRAIISFDLLGTHDPKHWIPASRP